MRTQSIYLPTPPKHAKASPSSPTSSLLVDRYVFNSFSRTMFRTEVYVLPFSFPYTCHFASPCSHLQPVDAGIAAKFTLREDRQTGTTESWRAWAENHEVEEWIQSIAGILPQGWNDQFASGQGPRHYEFPTGYNNYFTGMERFAVGEQFFAHSSALVVRFVPPLCNVKWCLLTLVCVLCARAGVEPEPAQDDTLTDRVFNPAV